MRYIFDLVPLRAFLLVMMAGVTIWIGILRSNAYPNRGEFKNLTIGSEQMHHAFAQSDLVVVGTVTQVRNYTATDGGHGYDIAVSDVLKGNQIERCSVRAGGWAYTIRFTLKQKVLLFLKQSNTFLPKERFVLTLNADQRPLAFRVEEGRIIGVDPQARHLWEGRSLQEIREILQHPK